MQCKFRSSWRLNSKRWSTKMTNTPRCKLIPYQH